VSKKRLTIDPSDPKAVAAFHAALKAQGKARGRSSKYNSRPCWIDGRRFASQREGACYLMLRDRQRKGEINALCCQVPFKLFVNGQYVTKYVADFVYLHNGGRVVVDSKGVRTPVYRLKKALMVACLDIDIVEV
jgi:hypothetical protein